MFRYQTQNAPTPGAPKARPAYVKGQPVIIRGCEKEIGRYAGSYTIGQKDVAMVNVGGILRYAYMEQIAAVDDCRSHMIEAVKVVTRKAGIRMDVRSLTKDEALVTLRLVNSGAQQNRKGELVLKLGGAR